MSVKLLGNELNKLYKFDREDTYLYMYRKVDKNFHPHSEGYLTLWSNVDEVRIKWFAINKSTTYSWDEVDSIDFENGRSMIKAVFEKNLNPPLKEVLY